VDSERDRNPFRFSTMGRDLAHRDSEIDVRLFDLSQSHADAFEDWWAVPTLQEVSNIRSSRRISVADFLRKFHFNYLSVVLLSLRCRRPTCPC
jgi:hypothetical protein